MPDQSSLAISCHHPHSCCPDLAIPCHSCQAEVGYEYLGGDLIGSNGQPVKYENVATPQECCQVGEGGAA